MPITINAEPRESIVVELVGVKYNLMPPKSSLALKMAVRAKTASDDPTEMMEAMYEWVDSAFGEEATAVKARLDAADDLLDIDHIAKLMEAVMELASGNPST